MSLKATEWHLADQYVPMCLPAPLGLDPRPGLKYQCKIKIADTIQKEFLSDEGNSKGP
jgi:hypothetical protein